MDKCSECGQATEFSYRGLCHACCEKVTVDGEYVATLDETVECGKCFKRFVAVPSTYRSSRDGEFIGYKCECGYVNEK